MHSLGRGTGVGDHLLEKFYLGRDQTATQVVERTSRLSVSSASLILLYHVQQNALTHSAPCAGASAVSTCVLLLRDQQSPLAQGAARGLW